MCIIAVKTAKAPLLDERTLEICFENNPNGAGVAIYRPGISSVFIRKGFMEFRPFHEYCLDQLLQQTQ